MLLFLLLSVAIGKFTTLTFPVNQVIGNVYFLQKYGVDLGKGSFSFRIRLTKPFTTEVD